MSKRLPYSSVITQMAVAIARKTIQQRSTAIVTKRGRTYVVRSLAGDALPIVAQQRSWRVN